jgi:hypothetical protein
MEIEIAERDIELNFIFPSYMSDKNEGEEKQQCLQCCPTPKLWKRHDRVACCILLKDAQWVT